MCQFIIVYSVGLKKDTAIVCIIIAMSDKGFFFCMRGLKRQIQWFTVRDRGKIKKRDVYLKDETKAIVYCDAVIEVYKQ